MEKCPQHKKYSRYLDEDQNRPGLNHSLCPTHEHGAEQAKGLLGNIVSWKVQPWTVVSYTSWSAQILWEELIVACWDEWKRGWCGLLGRQCQDCSRATKNSVQGCRVDWGPQGRRMPQYHLTPALGESPLCVCGFTPSPDLQKPGQDLHLCWGTSWPPALLLTLWSLLQSIKSSPTGEPEPQRWQTIYRPLATGVVRTH